ncbi:hypothetical protein ACFQL4_23740 [Halosimplex aquaticum]
MVSDNGSIDMSVSVVDGDVFVDGTEVPVTAQSVILADADPDHARYDIVVAERDGSVSAVSGQPSATPETPSIPPNAVLLAITEVPANANGVSDSEIHDARAVLANVPNNVITQGSGSGLDADTLDGNDTPLPASALADGPGSGLDADTLDGAHASKFATDSELNSHASNAEAHHTRYSDSEAKHAALIHSEGFAPGFLG